MTEQELYRQKLQAQLDEWKAEIGLLKARAAGASVDARLEMKKQVEDLDRKLQDAGSKLSELTSATGDAWESVKKGADTAWDSMKASLGEARSKFKA